ncbi:MAG: serine hydrolase [Myxococcota bacterium]
MLLPSLLVVVAAAPPNFSPGLYEGDLRLSTGTVSVSLKLRRSMLDGHIDMPELGLRRHPLTAMVVDGNMLRFDLPGLPGAPRFTLKWMDQRFEGVYGQGGQTHPIQLPKTTAGHRLTKALRGLAPAINAALAKDGAGGLSYAVILEGEVRFDSFEGPRNAGPRITERTPFALGHLGRAIVSIAAAAWLESNDRWTWSTPITSVLPYFRLDRPDGGARATLASLLTGKLPIAEHAVAKDALGAADPATVLLRLGALPLATSFQESDWMYAVIGQLLADPPGESDGAGAVERFLSTYTLDFSYPTPASGRGAVPFRAAADLQGSTRALANLVRIYLGHAVLQPSTWNRIETSGVGGWTNGHRRGFRTRRTTERSSSASATMLLAPDDDAGVVVFVHRAQSPLSDLLADHLLERLLELVPAVDLAFAVQTPSTERSRGPRIPAQVKRTRPAHRLSDYTGVFVHPGYGRLIVENNSGRLGVRLGPLAAPLAHWHFETFVSDAKESFPAAPWTFITSVEGRIDAVESPLEPRVPPIRFARSR